MKKGNRLITLFAVLLAVALLSADLAQGRRLAQVFELCRHGARSPFYDNLNFAEWNMPLQQLTPIGMRQHYLIGRQLNKQLVQQQKLLDAQYNYEQVLVYTTDTQRAVMSAESQLLGLYFEAGQNLSPDYRFERQTDLPPLNIDPFWG